MELYSRHTRVYILSVTFVRLIDIVEDSDVFSIFVAVEYSIV